MRGSKRTIDGRWAAVCAAGFCGLCASGAGAVPLQFGSSYYELVLVDDPFTGNNNAWETGRVAAAARTHLGQAGYLATVGSQAENDFLFSLANPPFTQFTGAWLGGKAPGGWLTGPETGQAFTYTNWGGIEPNNNGFAYMNIGTSFGGIAPGQWADDSNVQGVPEAGLDPVIGYYVEYPVPEPAALAAIPATILLMRRRR